MKKLSIVVPIHNEEHGIEDFLHKKLFPAVDSVEKYKHEFVFVDDGSTDGSLKILQGIAEARKDVKIVALSRNFGKEVALAAGLQQATGDGVLSIDADGQQPPELIPQFVKAWEDGADIVRGVRDHYTKHGFVAKVGSKLFYKLLRKLGNETTVPGSTDYCLLDRMVVDEYNKMTEHNRITRGIIDWMGFERSEIRYVYGTRGADKTSYTFSKLMRLAMDSFVSMTNTPLLIFGYLGMVICFGALGLGLFCIVNQYILGDPLGLYWNGAVQMAIFITFLVGLVLISNAATALYISHIHAETQNRQLFIIDKKKSRNL